jgi:MinD-like ATPase involved in chromosome partitioning or flagellar assembly
MGKNVLLVDTDAATNGLTLLYLKQAAQAARSRPSEAVTPAGLFEDASSNFSLATLSEDLKLLPATYSFQNTDQISVEAFGNRLRKMVSHFREKCDYILLDAQAGSDEFARQAVDRDISDDVVIVSEYDPMSAAGVERLKALFGDSLGFFRTWILLNKVLPEFAESVGDFLEYVRFLSPIPWDADVVRAYARRSLALNLEEGNEHTLAILQALRTLLGDEIAQSLDQWLENRAAAIRAPVRDQAEETERELQHIVRQRIERERMRQMRQWVSAIGTAVTALIAAIGINASGLAGLPSWVIAGIAVTIVAGASGIAGFVNNSPRVKLEEDRLRRRGELLEERLRRLTELEEMNLKSHVKSRGRLQR